MADMVPTMHLRFIKRVIDHDAPTGPQFGNVMLPRKVRILQQLWRELQPSTATQWRDVPLEAEED